MVCANVQPLSEHLFMVLFVISLNTEHRPLFLFTFLLSPVCRVLSAGLAFWPTYWRLCTHLHSLRNIAKAFSQASICRKVLHGVSYQGTFMCFPLSARRYVVSVKSQMGTDLCIKATIVCAGCPPWTRERSTCRVSMCIAAVRLLVFGMVHAEHFLWLSQKLCQSEADALHDLTVCSPQLAAQNEGMVLVSD